MTEDHPTIKAYEQALWAEQAECRAANVDISLDLLEALHKRWTAWMRTLPDEAWARMWAHPESGDWNLDQTLQLYVWHGNHHVAHITRLRDRMGW